MAIQKIDEQTATGAASTSAGTQQEPEVKIRFSNGDLKAINEIMTRWRFKDVESLLGYAIAVLREAKISNKLYVESDTGKTALLPAKSSLKQDENESTSST